MTSKVRIINEGPNHVIVGTQTQRWFLKAGIAETIPVSEKQPIVITEYESEMNELNELVLPSGFKQ